MDGKELFDMVLEDSIRHAVSMYGIEGTEDAIKRIHPKNSIIRARVLEKLYKLYSFGR